jgi:hypothetical protein
MRDWLTGLYFKAAFPGLTEEVRQGHTVRYERTRDAILDILPRDIKGISITEERQIQFEQRGSLIGLEQLSDGYRGMLAWTVDLVRRLFDAFPDSPDPLKERGVVLLDEIDLHLHPRWQRSVVETVRKTFPNLQFIVTTHSPFIVQDMRPEDKIIILERENGDENAPVIARHEPGAVHDWTADQILSAFFGLKQGTRGEEAQKASARLERLLDAEAAGPITDKQRAEIQQLKERLDAAPLGDTPDEQEIFAAADVVLQAMRRRRLLRAEQRKASQENNNGNGVD